MELLRTCAELPRTVAVSAETTHAPVLAPRYKEVADPQAATRAVAAASTVRNTRAGRVASDDLWEGAGKGSVEYEYSNSAIFVGSIGLAIAGPWRTADLRRSAVARAGLLTAAARGLG